MTRTVLPSKRSGVANRARMEGAAKEKAFFASAAANASSCASTTARIALDSSGETGSARAQSEAVASSTAAMNANQRGAIARGMRVMSLPQRPTSIGALQAASAVGQGKLYRVDDELLREREVTSAQVLLTFFDMSARTHALNARQTLTPRPERRERPHR